MPNDTIQNTIAEVFAIEDTGVQLKLRDKSKRSLGSFFKAKKDGNPTQAYQQFQDMEIKSGSVVEISFKEVPYKDGLIKNVIGFREAGGRPLPQPKPKINNGTYDDTGTGREFEHQPIREPSYKPVEEKTVDWDKLGYEKTLSIWFAAELESGNQDKFQAALEKGYYWTMFQAIKKDADKRFNKEMSQEEVDKIAEQVPF